MTIQDGDPRALAALDARAVFDAMAELAVLHEVVLDGEGRAVDYRILDCNPAFTRATGIARERAIGRLASELYGGPPPYLDVYAAVAETGTPARFETRYAPLERHFAISVVSPRRGCFATIATDVTERERSLEALRRSEAQVDAERERLAVTLRSIGDAVMATDDAARVTLMNDVAEQLTGWTLADAKGRPIREVFDIVNEDTRQPAVDPVDRVLREGIVVGLANHTALVARDGTERPIADSGAPIRDRDGRILGAVLVFRDQTEERRAEQALRESEERYRGLVHVSPYAMYVHQDDALVFANPAALALLGATRDEELLGRSPFELFHPDDHDGIRARIAAVGKGGVAPLNEERIVRLDGAIRDVEVLAAPLRWQRAPAVQVILRDVTERRRADAERERLRVQLADAQRLETVGRLAGGVAHDFNNLLTVILSCGDALRAAIASGDAASAEDVEDICAAGARARDLTRRLLAVARKQPVAPVPLDLNDVVRGAEVLLRRVVGEHVEVALDLAPALWTTRCDRAQLEQVLFNLVVNARDAMPRGGCVSLETRNVPAGGADGLPGRRDTVSLTIRDTGTGMSDEVKRHLFEPFFTTKPDGQGTGLGLAMVYGIVKQSEGDLRVDSALGRGTAVEVRFPRTEAPTATLTPVPTAAHARGTERVFVVEDEAKVRGIMVRCLGEAGYRVRAAAGGREALEALDAEPGPVDLLVTDVVMPQVNGREVADAFRRRFPAVRVLFVSGYTQDLLAHHGTLEPWAELFPKPFTPSSLLARVRATLDRA